MTQHLYNSEFWEVQISSESGRVIQLRCSKVDTVPFEFQQDALDSVIERLYGQGLYLAAVSDDDLERVTRKGGASNTWQEHCLVDDVYSMELKFVPRDQEVMFERGRGEKLTVKRMSTDGAATVDMFSVDVTRGDFVRSKTFSDDSLYVANIPLKNKSCGEFHISLRIRMVRDPSTDDDWSLWDVTITAHPHTMLTVMSKRMSDVACSGVPIIV